MQNLKEIRKRIASVKSTRQITQAMKMVAAAKLRKVQNRVIQLRPYTNTLKAVLNHIIDALEFDIDDPLFTQRPVKKVLIVAISSNRGLCGAFNINVVKKVQELVENYQQQGIETEILGVGRKASLILKKRGYNVVSSENQYIEDISYDNSKQLANQLLSQFIKGQYDKIEIVRNSFKSTGSQLIINEQFLPLQRPEKTGSYQAYYIFDPGAKEILHELIYNKMLFIDIFYALLDSYSAEQAARMTAMHKATDNASELIRQLTLTYNKARQAAITKEILEVVNGAEALKNRE